MNYTRLHLLTFPAVLALIGLLGGMSFPSSLLEWVFVVLGLSVMTLAVDVLFIIFIGLLSVLPFIRPLVIWLDDYLYKP